MYYSTIYKEKCSLTEADASMQFVAHGNAFMVIQDVREVIENESFIIL